MYPILKRRSDEECEERNSKKDRVQVDLSKESDWAFMLMNYRKYKRPMKYEVTAHSYDDAVKFMSKVAEKKDHRSLIKVTALKLELAVRGGELEQVNVERFENLIQKLGVRHL